MKLGLLSTFRPCEHDSDSLTSLRVIVSALLRGKLWILCVADLSLAGSNS